MSDEIPDDVKTLAWLAAREACNTDAPDVDEYEPIAEAILKDRASDARLAAARAEGVEEAAKLMDAIRELFLNLAQHNEAKRQHYTIIAEHYGNGAAAIRAAKGREGEAK